MADNTVGFGKTSATITAGIAAASGGGVDTVTVFDNDALGNRVYPELITVNKDITLRSESALRKYIVPRATFNITSDATVNDLALMGMGAPATALRAITAGITVTLNRVLVDGYTGFGINGSGSGTTLTCNNCIVRHGAGTTGGAESAAYVADTSVVMVCNFCLSVASRLNGFSNFTTGPATSFTLNNCISFGDGTDFRGTITGTKNATDQASGAPGTSPIHNLTLGDMAFARDESPDGASQFPIDFRSVEAQLTANSSVIQDAGSPVSGVTTDYDGRARDATNPNVGPSEDFPGFGGAVVTAPSAPVIALVSVASGQFTISVTGDAGVTNQLRYRTGTGAWVNGITRSGDGNMVQTGLTDGTVYQVEVQAKSGGVWGPASNLLWITPTASADLPTSPWAIYADKIRDKLIASSHLTSWIQVYNAGETTSGHVHLGYNPDSVKKIRTLGPQVFVRSGVVDSQDSVSEKALKYSHFVRVTIVWWRNQRDQADTIRELNYLHDIVNEIVAVGQPFGGSGQGGTLTRFGTSDLPMQDENNPGKKTMELNLVVSGFMEEQA